MKLSERLETVISLLDPADCAADIGTDHGYVPVELVRRGIAKRALAMDVRSGPLSRAAERIQTAGLEDRIETRLSDGMEKLASGEADAVVIAGMGGELMIHILERGREHWKTVRQWILSPHSEIYKVRRFLAENGFSIVREAMVREDDKFYTVIRAGQAGNAAGPIGADASGCAGSAPDGKIPGNAAASVSEDGELQFYYGTDLIRRRDPVFAEFLREEEKKLTALWKDLSARAGTSPRAGEGLLEVEKKLVRNREVQNEMQ